jgi:GDP-D-mannose dehydratase
MFLMLQRSEPEDYVIATGETRKLQDFIEGSAGAITAKNPNATFPFTLEPTSSHLPQSV